MSSEIRDINLAPSGEQKIEWVKRNCDLLRTLEAEFEKTKPFTGKKIALSVHLEAKTAYLCKVLKAGGAEMYVTGSNPLSTQDDVAAALVAAGLEVHAWYDATDEEYNPTYVDDLFKKVILPRITLHNGKGKLSTEEACQRIRKLNIVAHCHGGYTALKLEEKMQEAMTLIGYNNDERKKIQSQLLVVAHAPACALGVSKSQFVSFKSVYDSDTPLKNNFFDRYIESRKAEERRRFVAEEDQNIDKIKQNRWFDLKPCFFAGKQGNLFLIKQKYEWIEGEGPFMINSDEHNNVQYKDKSQTKEGRMMAYFAKTILENGIKNSLQQDGAFVPLPSIESLVLDGDEVMASKAAKAFETMRENGKAFREKLFQVAMNTRTKIASKD